MQTFGSFQAVFNANGGQGLLSEVGVHEMGVFNGQQEREKVKQVLGEIAYSDDKRMARAKWQKLVSLISGEIEESEAKLTDPSSDAQQKEAVAYVQWIEEVEGLLKQQGTTMADLLTQDFDLS